MRIWSIYWINVSQFCIKSFQKLIFFIRSGICRFVFYMYCLNLYIFMVYSLVFIYEQPNCLSEITILETKRIKSLPYWLLKVYEVLKASSCALHLWPVNLPFVLMLNVHFWNYYVPSRAWTPRKPLWLDFFGINFPSHPRSKLPFFNFCGQDNRTRGKSCRYHMSVLHRSTAPPPQHLPLPPTSHLSPTKVSACRAILRYRAPLE